MAELERKHAACRECREKKLKCIPAEDGSEACHRCTRLGKDCQLPEVKQRKRKARLRGRVEQLESSYSEILSLLKQMPPAGANSSSSTIGSTETPSNSDTSRISQSTGLTSPLSGPNPTQADYLVEIPLEECDVLLNDYRRMSTNHFPFVIVPDTCPVSTLVEERPMLAQAIFVSTSWRFPARQEALKEKFLKELSDRYFIKSERSLDLLQALIVYFGWCHWHAFPVATQVFRLGSLVVTLAVELGINQRPMNVTQHEMIVGPSSGLDQNPEPLSLKFWGPEARRAYLGAFTISTYGLILFRKPSTLNYTQYLEDCAASLAADPQHCSDTTLIHSIRSLRIAEEITYTFDHGSKEKIGELTDEKIQILVRALSKQTEEWRSNLPSGVFNIARIQRSYWSSRAYLHEVGLYGLLQGQSPSVTRVSILYECFNATMKFLSFLLENGLEEMEDWTSLDWRALNFGIMLSTKSSIVLDAAYVSTEASQRAAWLGKCLDTLCLKAQELHRLKGDKCSYFMKIANEWANLKIYHQNCIQRNLSPAMASSTTQQQQQQHQPLPAPQQQPSANVPYMESGFDLDPFNELFWAGFGEGDQGVAQSISQGITGIYPM